MLDFVLRSPIFYKYSKLAKEQADALRVLHGFTDEVIRKRREELTIHNNHESSFEGEQHKDIGTRRKRALLDILLQSSIENKPLSDLDIREEVDTFMFEVYHSIFSTGKSLFYLKGMLFDLGA